MGKDNQNLKSKNNSKINLVMLKCLMRGCKKAKFKRKKVKKKAKAIFKIGGQDPIKTKKKS